VCLTANVEGEQLAVPSQPLKCMTGGRGLDSQSDSDFDDLPAFLMPPPLLPDELNSTIFGLHCWYVASSMSIFGQSCVSVLACIAAMLIVLENNFFVGIIHEYFWSVLLSSMIDHLCP